MAIVTKNFTLNVTPGAMPPTVHVSEYDIGRTYAVQLLDENGSAYEIPTGTTATVEGTLNGTVGFTTSATISNNQISFALTESMTAYAGKAWCKIKLTLNSKPIQTCAFVLAVDRAGVEADTVIGAPGFEEQIQDAVDDWLDEHPPASGGMTEEFKQALLACFENVAWINADGQDYYDALEAALYPPKTLVSISAAFNQGSAVIYDTDSLDSLKQYLTVTATYDDTSTGVVTNYTLSGTLTVGTSTITVLYSGKTTTFTVNVTAPAALASISAVFTQGSAVIYDTDSLDTLKQYLTVTATMSDSTTRTVTDYALSGTLSVGTSTITVSYGGKTTTFTVDVTSSPIVTLNFRESVAVSKLMAATGGVPQYGMFATAVAARATTTAPFANDNYVFTVTDSSKYSVAAYDVTSPTQNPTSYSYASLDGYYYQGGSKSVSWLASDSVTTPYVWLALKKNDGTEFTDAELANSAAAVVTVTQST